MKDAVGPGQHVDFFYLETADGGHGGKVAYRRDGSDREYEDELQL
jgi:hypothetical protein